ncbi:hypothetical protein NXC14_PA00438 (plasmid) [Rhizobium sp. NXC14]|nr:hypothetical protein NXC14_PA00438 [Rhizobium sp. NXC14]
MLDRMARGDMPNEQEFRTFAAASLEDQKEAIVLIGLGRRDRRPIQSHWLQGDRHRN